MTNGQIPLMMTHPAQADLPAIFLVLPAFFLLKFLLLPAALGCILVRLAGVLHHARKVDVGEALRLGLDHLDDVDLVHEAPENLAEDRRVLGQPPSCVSPSPTSSSHADPVREADGPEVPETKIFT